MSIGEGIKSSVVEIWRHGLAEALLPSRYDTQFVYQSSEKRASSATNALYDYLHVLTLLHILSTCRWLLSNWPMNLPQVDQPSHFLKPSHKRG